MNGNDMLEFDASIQAHHQVALERLSPRVQAQLAQRRNAALRGNSGTRSMHGLRYAAAGFAAIFALVIGLRFGPMPHTDLPPPGSDTMAVAPVAAADDLTMLDEDPEFYAWLGATDPAQVAME